MRVAGDGRKPAGTAAHPTGLASRDVEAEGTARSLPTTVASSLAQR